MVQKSDPLPGSGQRDNVSSPSPAGSNYTTASESGGLEVAEEPSPDDLTVQYGHGEVMLPLSLCPLSRRRRFFAHLVSSSLVTCFF